MRYASEARQELVNLWRPTVSLISTRRVRARRMSYGLTSAIDFSQHGQRHTKHAMQIPESGAKQTF